MNIGYSPHDPHRVPGRIILPMTRQMASALDDEVNIVWAAFIAYVVAFAVLIGLYLVLRPLQWADSDLGAGLVGVGAIVETFLTFCLVVTSSRLVPLVLDRRAKRFVRFTGPINSRKTVLDSGEGLSSLYAARFDGHTTSLDAAGYRELASICWGTIEYAPRSRTLFLVRNAHGHVVYHHDHYAPDTRWPAATPRATVSAPLATAGMHARQRQARAPLST